MRRLLPLLLLLAALALHGAHVHERAWVELRDRALLHDYATFDAAVAAARAGASPYDAAALVEHRRAPEPRVLSPYFYPPAFLVTMAWTQGRSPADASRVWFVVNEAALLGALLAWVALAGRAGAALSFALPLALLASVPDHLRFGQASALPLLLLLLSCLALSRGRERLAGLALGAAGALKLLPLAALVVVIAAGRWRATLWALLAFGALQLAAVAGAGLVGLDPGVLWGALVEFTTGVVPGLVTGEVRPPFPLDGFPNLSLPSVFARLAGEGGDLAAGSAALLASRATLVVLALSVALVARRADPDRLPLAFAALAVLPLALAPGYLFDHHLVLLLPALAYVVDALLRGAAPRAVAALAAPALLVLAWSIEDLRHRANPPGSRGEAWLWDAKTVAWVTLGALVVTLALREPRAAERGAAPALDGD